MIRRRSTVDHTERIKHNKQVEIFAILDLCLQLPSDDRIIIRNQIKAGDEDLAQRLYLCKRDKNYHALQIYLRKYVAKVKENDKFGLGLSKGFQRGRTPQTLKSMKNATETSYHNSIQNSIQSSPSAKKALKTSITMNEIEKKIEKQINQEIKREIEKQQVEEQQLRDITPREIKVQIRPLQVKRELNFKEEPQYSMKTLLKAKINQKMNGNTLQGFEQKENKQILTLNPRNSDQNYKKQKLEQTKYGQFYRRIRKVIQQAS